MMNVAIQDESGWAKMAVWEEKIGEMEVGREVRVAHVRVKEIRGEKKLSMTDASVIEVI